MKMRLKHTQSVPYGGMYKINRPDLGMVGNGTVFEDLIRNVRAFRKANAIPTGLGFDRELEAEICKLYPDESEPADPDLPTKARLTFEDLVHGTKVLLSFKLAGSPIVSKEEALRRGSICARCPLCVPFAHPCGGLCGELKTVVDSLTGGYDTQWDNDLRACSVCHCFYSSHIRIPYEHLEKGLTDEMKKQFQKANEYYSCWKVPA
jgi:hypothetical protein